MKVLTPGHEYSLSNFEDSPQEQTLQFIHKVPRSEHPSMSPQGSDPNELLTLYNGTTNEEVLEVLINRMNYLQMKFPCRENDIVITKLEEALMWLNKRTSDRVSRNVEGKQEK